MLRFIFIFWVGDPYSPSKTPPRLCECPKNFATNPLTGNTIGDWNIQKCMRLFKTTFLVLF